MGASVGLSRNAMYQYDYITNGTMFLWSTRSNSWSAGCVQTFAGSSTATTFTGVTPAGTTVAQVMDWMIGAVVSAPAGSGGTSTAVPPTVQFIINMTRTTPGSASANWTSAQALWDTGTSTYSIPAQYFTSCPRDKASAFTGI